jgi:hypothetical protein
MKYWREWIVPVIITVTFLLTVIILEAYKYKDCMKVGHSHLYCVMRLFGD